jgi:hypothetical protein
MIADTEKIAVIATRLPYIDRRSLSEAWFSALHLASDGPPQRQATPRRGVAEAQRPAGRRLGSDNSPRGEAAQAQRFAKETGGPRSSRTQAPNAALPPSPSRGGSVPEAVAVARSYPPFRTSLTFGVHGERVALSLRREGSTLHVVAVCRPEVEAIVRRALACVDLYLRVRGESVRASVSTVSPAGAA